jgi:hypothetical protein
MAYDGNVSVYYRKGVWYLRPVWTSTAGFHIGGEPLLVVPESAEAHERVVALRKSLIASRRTVVALSTTAGNRKLREPYLKAAGVRSWSAFFIKGEVRAVDVDMLGGKLLFTPMSYSYKDKGYTGMSASVIEVPADASDDEIDAALKRALSLCVFVD